MSEVIIGIDTKLIPWNERYAVSQCGKVFSRRGRVKGSRRGLWNQWKELKPWAHPSGHLYVGIDGKSCQVHRLVLELFCGPCPKGTECRHVNGTPSDNRIGNLAWGTRPENCADKIRHGTHNRGIRHYAAKLTSNDVCAIRELRLRHPSQRSGIVSFLSRWYEMSIAQISCASRGVSYAK